MGELIQFPLNNQSEREDRQSTETMEQTGDNVKEILEREAITEGLYEELSTIYEQWNTVFKTGTFYKEPDYDRIMEDFSRRSSEIVREIDALLHRR